MERVPVRLSLVLLFAGCLADPKRPSCMDDGRSSDPAFTAAVLGCDDFERRVTSGWGSADVGGGWSVTSSNVASVSSGHGKIALATTMTGAQSYLGTVPPALDVETRAIVTFDRLPMTGNYDAYVGVRSFSQGGAGYVLNLDAGGSLLPFISVDGNRLVTATSPITVSANVGVELSLVATGASPTTLCGKVWLEGTSEPSVCTVFVLSDNTGAQVSGTTHLGTDSNGSTAPNVSFSSFRYLQLEPK
jgi:hypothetical protein